MKTEAVQQTSFLDLAWAQVGKKSIIRFFRDSRYPQDHHLDVVQGIPFDASWKPHLAKGYVEHKDTEVVRFPALDSLLRKMRAERVSGYRQTQLPGISSDGEIPIFTAK